jgi:hypothetical protein
MYHKDVLLDPLTQQKDKVRKGPAKGFHIGTVSFVSSKISMKQNIQRMCFACVYDHG